MTKLFLSSSMIESTYLQSKQPNSAVEEIMMKACLKIKSTYSEVSIIRPGRSRLLEFEI